MSDHLPILATRKYNRTRSKNNRFNTISYTDIKNQDKDAFVESLKTAPWDCAFMLTTKTSKTQKSTKWFNVNILKEIRTRDNSLKKAKKKRNFERDWDMLKRAKNSVSSFIRRTKQAYSKNT